MSEFTGHGADADAPTLMEGSAIARAIIDASAERAAAFADQTGARPCLATVLVGEDPA